MSIKKNILCAAPAAALILAMSSANALTITESVQTAIDTNPKIKAAAADKREIDHEVSQSRSFYYPTVDIYGGAGTEWTKNTSIRTGTNMPRYESAISINQVVFDGFKREGNIDKSASRADAAALRTMQNVDSIALDAILAYIDVLRHKDITTLATKNVKAHKRIVENVRKSVKAGKKGVAEIQQATARLARAEDDLINTQRDLKDAEAAYERTIGTKPLNLKKTVLENTSLPETKEIATCVATFNHPAISRAAAELDEAYAEKRVAGAGFWPTANIELDATKNRNLDGTRGSNHDAKAMFVLRWNLFRGGIDKHKRLGAIEGISSATQNILDYQREINKETTLAWNSMEAANRRIATLKKEVTANTKVVKTYTKEFNIGKRDLLDLLDSENELYNSKVRLVTAKSSEEYNKYRVLANMSTLVDTIGAVAPVDTRTIQRKDAGINTTWNTINAEGQTSNWKDLPCQQILENKGLALTAK
ncbi:MAG: TolC family outer membrane protein [Alphaproteobacteria bacterium]|nr:TolC family outer membrane protein [Alphaproteobacteria bacterium]